MKMDKTGNSKRYKFLLFTYIICASLFSISLFLSSFFPINYHSNSTATINNIPTEINGIKLNTNNLYKPMIKKIVFMVIDALRWDFVKTINENTAMPVTLELINNKSACLIQARANAPTVTMPRIKSMMTGTVSSFIDVALNLGETSVTTDSLLQQAKYHGHNLIFYGDNTWLKLFPELFDRHEGTTSFYVSDFTEVDNNVTRNINKELNENDDWSIMVLHYLGLDHIGHTFGPRSSLIEPKLREMDDIIDTIYEKIRIWNENGIPSLLIVCGDHGMKNSGGHGGATPEETLVPFIVFGRTCSCNDDNCQIEQVDVAATLSMLLGLPLPHSNLGSVSINLIEDLSHSEKLFLLHYNAKHMFSHFRKLSEFESSEIYDNYYKVIKLHTEWLIGKNRDKANEQFNSIIKLYERVLKGMKNMLIKSAVKYDRTIMIIAIVLIFQILLIIISNNFNELFTVKLFFYWWLMGISLWLLINHFLYNENNEIYFEINDFKIIIIVFVLYTINSYLCTKISINLSNLEFLQVIIPIAMITHAISLSSSSYIEEEHQTWYFFWPTYLTCLIYLQISKIENYKKINRNSLMKISQLLFLFLQHRVLRKLNSTGNKYAHLPDISGFLKSHESNVPMTIIVAASLVLLLLISFMCEDKKHRNIKLIINVIQSICIYTRHTSDNSVMNFLSFHSNSRGINEVRIFWFTLLIFLIFSIKRNYSIYKRARKKLFNRILHDLIEIIVMIILLLHRPQNIVLVPMELITIFIIFNSININDNNLIYIMYWIGNLYYFYQGNSNSIATIDVAAGYVGLNNYSSILTTLYICINTYSGQILTYLMLMYKLNSIDSNNHSIDNVFLINRLYTIMRIFPLAIYTIIVTIHRYHLFIWTVFSPKLLYESMYTAGLFVMMFLMTLIFLLTDKK